MLALATGFDVPDVDCIIWLRPTQSPVLYVQGAGRGLRIAEGKQNCLWIDFSDTTERLGPVDGIRGRKRGRKSWKPSRRSRCAANAAIRFALPVRLNARTAAQRCANPNQKKPGSK